MSLVVPTAVCLNQLDTMTDTGGMLDACTLKLFSNNVTPSPTSALADFTASSYAGSTGQAITWATPYVDDDGNATVLGGTHQFTCTTAPTSSEPIYGYFVVKTTGGALVYAERFTGGPASIVAVNDAVVIVPRFTLKSQS